MKDIIKYDCFAYRCKTNKSTGVKENKCDALNELYCKKQSKCEFYQEKEEFEKRKEALFNKKIN